MARTILLADDSVTIRKVVELTFSDTDIRVEAVESGQEALERITALRPDLVLADVVMPGPSGYEICRAVKSSSRPVPVLLLTGAFEPFDPALAKACGSDGHITKPFDSRSLVERVDALLTRGASPRQTVQAPDKDIEELFDELADTRRAPQAAAPDAPVPPEPAPAPVATPAEAAPEPAAPTVSAAALSPGDIDAIAAAVVARLSDRVLREIAWDVVPDMAEMVVRERLREIERGGRETS